MPVYNLTLNNFNKVYNIISKKTVIIYYYTDTCPFCIMFKALWKEILKKYKTNKNVTIVNINRNIMHKLDEKMHVDLVPSIIVYKNLKKISEYRKEREYNKIIKFIDKIYI